MSWLRLVCYSVAILGLCCCGRGPVLAKTPSRLAYTDPFSGPFASGGDEFLKIFQFHHWRERTPPAGRWAGNSSSFRSTNKLQPAEALIALKNMIDQNSRSSCIARVQCRLGADRRGVEAQRAQPRTTASCI